MHDVVYDVVYDARFCLGAQEVVMQLSKNDIFAGRYKVLAKIGEGGVGEVYRAWQVGLKRDVVIKILKPASLLLLKAKERFEREAQMLACLNHPNIVVLYDFGSYEGSLFLVMEYINGHNLGTFLKRHGVLPMEVFFPIACQILEALGESHILGMVHRDLKPGNIMITSRRNSSHQVKVLDFGLAKFSNRAETSELTNENTLVGSIAYLAPEQIQGIEIDTRADIYALGVVFYMMLTGQKPFDGPDMTVLYHHLNTPPPSLRDKLPADHDVPDGVIDLLDACLSKDRDDRPQNAYELHEYLLSVADMTFERGWSTHSFSNPRHFLQDPSDTFMSSEHTGSVQIRNTFDSNHGFGHLKSPVHVQVREAVSSTLSRRDAVESPGLRRSHSTPLPRVSLKPERIRRVASRFIGQLPELILELEDALEASDVQRVQELCTKIREDAEYLDMVSIEKLMPQIALLPVPYDLTHAMELTEQIENAYKHNFEYLVALRDV